MRVVVMLFALASLGWGGDDPRITHVGLVAPDVVGITIHEGRVEYGRQIPYEPQPGDKVDRKSHQRWVTRNGNFIGALVGADEQILCGPDRRLGAKLDVRLLDKAQSYAVGGKSPVAVYRKSKPTDFARVGPWHFDAPMEHVVYLRLASAVKKGARVAIRAAGLPEQTLVVEPEKLRSEAVHVSHLGFRPDDPAKVAFLSCWMGGGGGVTYEPGIPFSVIDGQGKAVFQGKTRLSKKGTDRTEDAYKNNHNGVDVFIMDFSDLKALGMFRVCVEGIGCSYSFPIGADVWAKAFVVSARGFYHQRSGIALGPPHTTFKRPRSFHPDDGLKVYQSRCPLMDTANGLDPKSGNFANLVKGRTDTIVPNAWGGYMDAGDWDRRIQHLVVSRLLLELAGLFPERFEGLSLNVPESGGALPDIVDEALFNLDFYRRLQTAEGGIRGGIESSEHPRQGEGSWQESLTVMAYAPDEWSSWTYASVAARAAHVVAKYDADRARAYLDSARRAMEWAEIHYAADPDRKRPHQVKDVRNLAAVELFRATGEKAWLDIFLATTFFKDPKAPVEEWKSHDQEDAAWVCARLDRPGLPDAIRANCLNALKRRADERVRQISKTGFRWTKNPWRPTSWGVLAAPDAVSIVRAHALTGESQYLRAAVLACQTGAGANPANICYTTGLGHKSPQHPLHIDSRISHQPPPPGLTVFGPADVVRDKNAWGQKNVARFAHPHPQKWPTIEAWWDVFWYPGVCEFTVQSPMAQNAYVWGYLAARE